MKYQMTCPKCHYEFTYDNGYYDKNIARLGVEINDIMRQLAEHNLLPWPEKKARTEWWLRAKKALAEKQKELAELKAIRKVCDQQIKFYEYQTLGNRFSRLSHLWKFVFCRYSSRFQSFDRYRRWVNSYRHRLSARFISAAPQNLESGFLPL